MILNKNNKEFENKMKPLIERKKNIEKNKHTRVNMNDYNSHNKTFKITKTMKRKKYVKRNSTMDRLNSFNSSIMKSVDEFHYLIFSLGIFKRCQQIEFVRILKKFEGKILSFKCFYDV